MKVENPCFYVEPIKGPPFFIMNSSTADAIISEQLMAIVMFI